MSFFVDLDARYLKEEHRMMRAVIRRFVEEEVKPNGEQWEEAGRIPVEVLRKLGDLGVLGITYPERYGGSNMGALGALVLCEEVGRSTFGGFALTVAVHADMVAHSLVNHGSDFLKDKYLPDIVSGRKYCSICVTEPGGGSDVAGLKTSARRDGDDYLISGSKLYITSGVNGDVYLVAARTDPSAKGSRGISMFLLERGMAGFSISPPLKKTGCLSSETAQLFFDEVRVPARNLVGEEGRGFYYAMEGFERERIGVGALCVGQCEAAIELTMDWLKNRKAFGGSLWDLHGIKLDMARLVSELAAAKLLVYHAAYASSQGEDATALACMVKTQLPPLTNRILYQCVQYHGGMGYMRENPVERISRDARLFAIGGGATEVMLLEVAKNL